MKRHFYCKPSIPALPPNAVVLQFTPSNHLHSLGKHCLDFHRYDRVSGQVRLNHPADQEVLLFGDGFDGSPLGQKQFFRIQRVHGLCKLRGGFSFPALRPSCGDTDVHTMSKQMKNRVAMIERHYSKFKAT